MKKILSVIFVMCLVACEEEGVEKTCLPPPCGVINDETFNISFVYEGDLNDYKSDSIVWTVAGKSTELSLAGDTQGYSCWNQTEIYPSVSLLNSITYVRNGYAFKINIDGAKIQTNSIRVDLLLSGVESYYDWFNECNDTPNG